MTHPPPCTCGRVRGRTWRPGDCRPCWLARYDPRFGGKGGGPKPTPPPDPCPHLGRELTGPERQAANLGHGRRWSLCTHPAQPLGPHVCPCKGCGPKCPGHPANVPARPSLLPPLSVAEIGPAGLTRTNDRGAFNGGHLRYQGRLLLAYRSGWSGSVVHVAEMSDDWAVTRSIRLDLTHPECAAGCEDPRLLEHNGRLYVSFIGVWRKAGKIHTSQLYAVLRDDLTVEAVYCPRYAARTLPFEKNWAFFSRGGVLYAVYSISPRHVVLRIDGERAEVVADEPYPFAWSGGFLRGGAPPVLVGDRYYHFTHGRLNHDGTSTYSAGVYTFAADPPFAPIAAVEQPLLWADPVEAKTVDRGNLAVVFPCGASLAGGRWTVVAGWNDNRLKRITWGESGIARLLSTPVPPPAWLRFRHGSTDAWIWNEVVERDEYGLDDLDLDGRAVLDIGAHVGIFAYAAVTRGAAVVYCYEPSPDNLGPLESHAAHMPGVTVFPHPIGARPGESRYLKPLFDPANFGGRAVSADPAAGVAANRTAGVNEAVRACAAADPLGRVSLLKLDCEGGEWDILAGLTPDAAGLIDRVVGEWHPPGGQAELRALLAPLGFVVTGRDVGGGRGIFAARRLAPAAG